MIKIVSIKNYMGVPTQALTNAHQRIATGGLATLMVECGLPTLNIIDAIWVNANPANSLSAGPATSYREATRVNMLIAGVDPVALDYWSSKNILMKTSEQIGYTDTHTLDPDNSLKSGLTEAFGVWLKKSKDELIRGGYNVTSNEQEMNFYVNASTISSQLISPILAVIPLQLLALYMSIERGIDPDYPRNLSKTLTVD